MTPTKCPQCMKDDMIQKVSAIYSGGITTGSFSGPTNLQGSTQTAMSRMFTPPSEPKFKNPPLNAIELTTQWIVMGIFLVSILAFKDNWGNANLGNVFILNIPLAVIWAVIFLPGYNRRKQEAMTKHQSEVFRWQEAISTWNQLYYCSRDDIVFDPSSRTSTPPHRMRELLHY